MTTYKRQHNPEVLSIIRDKSIQTKDIPCRLKEELGIDIDIRTAQRWRSQDSPEQAVLSDLTAVFDAVTGLDALGRSWTAEVVGPSQYKVSWL